MKLILNVNAQISHKNGWFKKRNDSEMGRFFVLLTISPKMICMEWEVITPLTEYEAKTVVKDYLSRGGFTANDIDTRNQPEGLNIPDIEVNDSTTIVAYCEVKTPEHKLNPQTRMYRWDTTIRKLRDLSRKAVKQLEAFDSVHKYPRIIVFTSNHPQLNWTNCVHHMQGAVSYNKEIIRDFRSKKTGWDLAEDLQKIELIIWLQIDYITRKDIAQATHLINNGSKLLAETKVISKKLPIGVKP